MSWDISIKLEHCRECLRPAETISVGNTTYNNSAIFNELGCHPASYEGLHAREVSLMARNALERAQDPLVYVKLHSLRPETGWGGIESSLQFLTKLRENCELYPKGILEVS
jgi:hypothetical protein